MPNYRRSRTTGGVFFFTVVTHNRFPLFKSVENIRAFRNITNTVRHELPFKEIACVILHDHVHSIWELPEGDYDFSKRWGIIKARFTKYLRCNSVSCHNQNIWQNRFWEHDIRNSDDLKDHLDYLHYNPVKHCYVNKVVDWPYSSFHRFVDQGYYSYDRGRNVAVMDLGTYGE